MLADDAHSKVADDVGVLGDLRVLVDLERLQLDGRLTARVIQRQDGDLEALAGLVAFDLPGLVEAAPIQELDEADP